LSVHHIAVGYFLIIVVIPITHRHRNTRRGQDAKLQKSGQPRNSKSIKTMKKGLKADKRTFLGLEILSIGNDLIILHSENLNRKNIKHNTR